MSPIEPDQDELTIFRRQALLAAMQDLSEDCWAAGWYTGLERDLYRIVFEGALSEYGMGWVSAMDRRNIAQWAAFTDTWYCWSDDERRPVSIPLSEARSRFRCIVTACFPEGLTVREAHALYDLSGPDDWELEPFLQYEVAKTPLIQWLHRAREMYRFTTDPSLYLVRRHDFQFVLGYGTCQVDLVQPSWLPHEAFLRAEGCSEIAPCE